MRRTLRSYGALAAALLLAAPIAGCAAAVAAGAAGGIYATTRGVESIVTGSVDQVAERAQTVMQQMNIVQQGSSTDDAEAKRSFKGKQGDLDITIDLAQQDTATTKVEVYARKNLAEWDKGYAREVLQRIVAEK